MGKLETFDIQLLIFGFCESTTVLSGMLICKSEKKRRHLQTRVAQDHAFIEEAINRLAKAGDLKGLEYVWRTYATPRSRYQITAQIVNRGLELMKFYACASLLWFESVVPGLSVLERECVSTHLTLCGVAYHHPDSTYRSDDAHMARFLDLLLSAHPLWIDAEILEVWSWLCEARNRTLARSVLEKHAMRT